MLCLPYQNSPLHKHLVQLVWITATVCITKAGAISLHSLIVLRGKLKLQWPNESALNGRFPRLRTRQSDANNAAAAMFHLIQLSIAVVPWAAI